MANKIKGKHGKKGYRNVVKSTEKRTGLKRKFTEIFSIWQNETAVFGGNFIRHIDGKRQHNSIYNLAMIHPHDAFKHPDWVVDWKSGLSQAQIDFVREHMAFLADYCFTIPFSSKQDTFILKMR